jgi:hypothetical protein
MWKVLQQLLQQSGSSQTHNTQQEIQIAQMELSSLWQVKRYQNRRVERVKPETQLPVPHPPPSKSKTQGTFEETHDAELDTLFKSASQPLLDPSDQTDCLMDVVIKKSTQKPYASTVPYQVTNPQTTVPQKKAHALQQTSTTEVIKPETLIKIKDRAKTQDQIKTENPIKTEKKPEPFTARFDAAICQKAKQVMEKSAKPVVESVAPENELPESPLPSTNPPSEQQERDNVPESVLQNFTESFPENLDVTVAIEETLAPVPLQEEVSQQQEQLPDFQVAQDTDEPEPQPQNLHQQAILLQKSLIGINTHYPATAQLPANHDELYMFRNNQMLNRSISNLVDQYFENSQPE